MNLLNEKLKYIPKKPGCYMWKDINNQVIYVGKAKNLYNRMHQYFDPNKDNKTLSLVKNIFDFDYIIVDNPNEALVLENNLIKKYLPKFNILLKESSDYPYIVLTNEDKPRLLYTHKYGSIKGKYYGPLADNNFKKYEIYKLLLEISPFDKNSLFQNNISYFEQYINSSMNNYNKNEIYDLWKKYIDDLFNGKSSSLIEIVHTWEQKACELYNFEQAQKYNEIIDGLKKIGNSQIVQFNQNKYTDYIAYYIKNNYISINIFSYINGKLLTKHNSLHQIYDQSVEEILSNFVMQYYSSNNIPNKIIISLSESDCNDLSNIFNTIVDYPKNNNDLKIMDSSLINAQDNYYKQIKLNEIKNKIHDEVLLELSNIVKLNSLYKIEIYDNSNLDFKDPVCGVAVYINGKSNKKMYRKYKLNDQFGIGDSNYMYQAISKRLNHLLKYNESLPNLIIVDGGKIQVGAALKALNEFNLYNKIKVIGLKKNSNHKTESIIFDDYSEYILDKKSNLYLFLLNMQEEVHKLAISYFRKENLKSSFRSFFSDIKGIGKARMDKLLLKYPSLVDINNASNNELSQIIPLNIVLKIKEKIKKELKL